MGPAPDISTQKTLILPRILTQWPWSQLLSEHHKDVGADSTAWAESFHPFEGRSLEAFRKCKISLLASLSYSPRDKVIIRLGCDLMHLFFIFDEYSDVEGEQGCRIMHQEIQDILANPEIFGKQNDTPVSGIARDFWLRARAYVSSDASCIHHFIDGWTSYTKAVIEEADDRTNKRYRSFEDYMRIRRHTAGAAPTLSLIEFGLDLPDEVFNHPVVSSLRNKAETLIALINDIYSYIMEKSRGLAVHNGVEIVIRERNISIQEAMDWLGNYCNEIADSFLVELKSLPSWGPDVDSRLATYVNGLGQSVRGNDDWHFESSRYFGDEAATVKKTRVATLVVPSRGYVQCPRRENMYEETSLGEVAYRPGIDSSPLPSN